MSKEGRGRRQRSKKERMEGRERKEVREKGRRESRKRQRRVSDLHGVLNEHRRNILSTRSDDQLLDTASDLKM